MAKEKKQKLGNANYIFKHIIWPRKWILFAGLGIIVINRLASLVLPKATGYLIDTVITPARFDLLPMLLVAVGGAVLVQAISSFSLTRMLSVEAQYLIAELRSKVQQHVVQLPISFFDNNKTGALVSRIMSDVEGVRNLVGTGFVQLLGGALTSVLSFILLIKLNAIMTLYVLLPMLIFGIVAIKAFGYIRPIFRKRGEINARVTGRLTESLGGIRIIKGFNAEDFEIDIFRKGVLDLYYNVKKSLTSTALITSSSVLLMGVAFLIIMGVGSRQIELGVLTIGEFFEFTLYLGFLIAPIVQMGNIGSQMTEAFAGLDRMEEILNTPMEEEEGKKLKELTNIKGTIEFKNVAFAYDKKTPVINDISFLAKAGETIALVGTSGSGKSTIASLASSFIQPKSGQVLIDGVNLKDVGLKSYRKHLGVVLQDDFLFEGTIKENILFSRPSATEEDLQHAVKHAYVHEFTKRFKDGLNTLIGERGVKLSGGQRQRLAIARAILANPKILILDEATSSLDTESEAFIQESLDTLLKGRTTLVIAHRLSTIRKADQILVIEKGEIVERGNHDDLIASKGRYYNLYTYQARI